MLRFQFVQLLAFAVVFVAAGPIALAMYIGAGTVGFLLLETGNRYVEHYGLSRDKKANGKYERVQPHHSWNSNHSVGRALLFELTRHSDHHAYPGRKYPVLRHFDSSPQFPAWLSIYDFTVLVAPSLVSHHGQAFGIRVTTIGKNGWNQRCFKKYILSTIKIY